MDCEPCLFRGLITEATKEQDGKQVCDGCFCEIAVGSKWRRRKEYLLGGFPSDSNWIACVMTSIEGYVMIRFPECKPYVLHQTELLKENDEHS